ncbi:hypothetical protein [Novosphingobium terrae]|uniref:hypothetical protein n=1 Tax=Novosphingobium terrae TaxID=2726189 RepID=UPI0019820593|nr:hypothetical protein [Novosphingobium terrae]
MPIPESSVVVGGCYETAEKQQRRVIKIQGDKVTYQSWGGNVQNTKGPLPWIPVNIKKFAQDVEQAIACPADLPPMPTAHADDDTHEDSAE